MEHQFSKEEIDKIQEILNKYNTIASEMMSVQEKLDELNVEKNELIQKLEKNRADERKLISELENKYNMKITANIVVDALNKLSDNE